MKTRLPRYGFAVTGSSLGRLALLLTLVTACGKDSPTKVESVETVTVTAPVASLTPGETMQLQFTARDASGNALSGRTATWSTSSSAIATVSSTGLVTAVTVGSATITATVDGKSGSVSVMIVPPPVATVTVTAESPAMLVSETQTLTAELRDRLGRTLTGRSVSWSSSAPEVATVSSGGVVAGVSPGTVTITATSEGKSGSVGISVSQQPVATVEITGAVPGMLIGDTVSLAVVLRDVHGNELTDRTVTWGSSHTEVATVSAGGVVVSVGIGNTTITATSEGKSGTAEIAVSPRPVASIEVSTIPRAMLIGDEKTLVATVKDDRGNILTDRAVTWTSGNPAVATVSSSGKVTAIAVGDVTITATSEGKSATSAVRVRAEPEPEITAVSTLRGRGAATITGLNFAPTVAGNIVTIRGQAVEVTSATTTMLDINVPCVPSGAATVRVTRGDSYSNDWPTTITNPLAGVTAGEPVIIERADAGCVELPAADADGKVLVMIANTAESLNSKTTVQLSGTSADATAMRYVTSPALPASLRASLGSQDGREARMQAEHMRHLERERMEYEALRARIPNVNRLQASRDDRADPPEPGDTRTFFYNYDNCYSAPTITARAVWVGEKGVVWEDVTNIYLSTDVPKLKAYYEKIGQIFDDELYPTVKDNFGDPLLRDAETDGDGKLHMLFSRRLDGSGLAGYVTSCDQYPHSIYPSGNYNQMFYAIAPMRSGDNANDWLTVDGWFYFMVRTVVHEVKHIASHSARIKMNAQNWEVSWLEEGSARMAEEMWVRPYVHKTDWKGNAGWGSASTNGVYCDFFPSSTTCNSQDPLHRPTYGMRRHFDEILEKFLEPWEWSPYGRATDQSSSAFYNVSWSLLRWTMDRYATSETAFLKDFTNTAYTGTANLARLAGTSMADLITNWGLALYADDYPGMPKTNLSTQFQTWDLRSIYAGLNEVWSSRYTTPFPLVPTPVQYGSFVASPVSIRSGAHAYYEFGGGSSAPLLLHLDAPPSSSVRLAVLRLK